MKIRVTLLLTLILVAAQIQAVDTCSRLAIINYQEVLVDTNSTEKGEGLRFHIEKDPVAKSYLDTYQQGTQIRWQNAALGTVGTGMMLAGVIGEHSADREKVLLFGGATLMLINFFVARTLESSNEQNLIKAIEEYNKRNLPKIYFNPEQKGDGTLGSEVSLVIGKDWSF